ncbi:MAG TPA: serine/threonine-protein kinase [Ramlibacter sp.]|nr:serine/threonine-protein kinase [Ramlibacter sp.]
MASAIPSFIGKYNVVRELGRGASSTVYLAEDPFNGRKVALKQIHAHLIADETKAARYKRAMRNEALLAGRLKHPYIVAVYDADGEANPPYIVLEHVEGAPLGRFTSPDRLLPIEQVLDICYKCCNALEYAHTHGLVHRDIKPANLMLQTNGDIKLMDFGTALTAQGDITQITGIVGSPQYMAPEQVREEPCTWRSDLFSLGIVAYELLTGRPPFEGDTDYATMYKITSEEPTLPSTLRPGLPEQIDRVLMRALAKDPEARFKQWMDFAESMLQVNRGFSERKVRHREGDAFARMRQLPFFSAFPDPVLWEALRLGTLSLRPAETVLMEEGAMGDSFLLLLQGNVSVMRDGFKVATLEPGVTLGEMAYLRRDEPKRTATAVAETAVLVLEIRNDALHHASDELQICFDKAFIDLLLHRLVDTTGQLRKLAKNSVSM